MKQLLALALMATLSVSATDLTGRWTGTMEKIKGGPDGPPVEEYNLVLRHTADAIDGTIGPDDAGWKIHDAKLDGSQLNFSVALGDGAILIAFSLRVHGDELQGTMESKKGPPIVGKLSLKRQK
jgi:hypothetical protein